MFPRPQYLDLLVKFKDTEFIKVITGVRRSGKSVLMQLYKSYLEEQGISSSQIIYINLEGFEYQSITSAEALSALLKPLLEGMTGRFYLLIDEIQFVEGWQKVINGIRVSFDCEIVLTGSNASMLSGELATLLSGRYIEIPVYPLSFKEFLVAKGIDQHDRMVDRAYEEYERYGGFPSVVMAEELLKDTILSGIFDTIILNDIGARYGIKDPVNLRRIVSFMADNVGQLINANKIANVLKNEQLSITTPTIMRYLDLFESAYLFYQARQYDIRGKDYLRTNGKYFMVDNGLRRHAVGHKEANYSNRLENLVYMELKRRGYTVDVGKIDQAEIDFIARKVDEVMYVQVAYDLPNNTHESDNLLRIPDNYKKIIITGRYRPEKEVDGIPIQYVVDWLLDEEFN